MTHAGFVPCYKRRLKATAATHGYLFVSAYSRFAAVQLGVQLVRRL